MIFTQNMHILDYFVFFSVCVILHVRTGASAGDQDIPTPAASLGGAT